MSVLTKGVFDALSANATLVALLGVHSSTHPCIFHRPDVPVDAPRPYVHIQFPVTQTPDDTKTRTGLETLVDILAVCDVSGTFTLIDQINAEIRRSLHRVKFTLDSGHVVLAAVSGPLRVPADDSVIATVMSLRTIHE